MDTLFVFQLLFISIIIISILMMFSYQGAVGRAFVVYTFVVLVIVDIIVIINRSMYTNQVRDKKQWDKVVFDSDRKMISPKGKDRDYIAKLDAAYGENGVQLSDAEKTAIINSSASSAALAKQYGISQETVCSIRSKACSKC
jgi:hypothetical protein